jgi:hypothetical protein
MIVPQQTRQAEHSQAIINLALWLAVGLAMLTAFMYALIAFGVLGIGQEGARSDAMLAWVLAIGGYVAGGLLILVRSRKLWITGAVINGLVLLAFVRNWSGSPDIMFSAGGLATKIPQLLLEVVLVYLILATGQTKNGIGGN